MGEDGELLCLVVYDKTGRQIIDNYFIEEGNWQDFLDTSFQELGEFVKSKALEHRGARANQPNLWNHFEYLAEEITRTQQ